MKCDRIRPICLQCTKGKRLCRYVDEEEGKGEFFNETPALVTRPKTITPPSPDTWGSVIDHQVNLFKKANDGKSEIPVWVVAEAEEVPMTYALHVTYS